MRTIVYTRIAIAVAPKIAIPTKRPGALSGRFSCSSGAALSCASVVIGANCTSRAPPRAKQAAGTASAAQSAASAGERTAPALFSAA